MLIILFLLTAPLASMQSPRDYIEKVDWRAVCKERSITPEQAVCWARKVYDYLLFNTVDKAEIQEKFFETIHDYLLAFGTEHLIPLAILWTSCNYPLTEEFILSFYQKLDPSLKGPVTWESHQPEKLLDLFLDIKHHRPRALDLIKRGYSIYLGRNENSIVTSSFGFAVTSNNLDVVRYHFDNGFFGDINITYMPDNLPDKLVAIDTFEYACLISKHTEIAKMHLDSEFFSFEQDYLKRIRTIAKQARSKEIVALLDQYITAEPAASA